MLAVQSEAGAGEWPIFGARAEPCGNRIGLDVPDESHEVLVRADHVVEVGRLPDWSFVVERVVDPIGRV